MLFEINQSATNNMNQVKIVFIKLKVVDMISELWENNRRFFYTFKHLRQEVLGHSRELGKAKTVLSRCFALSRRNLVLPICMSE